jgi:hypothetical protein
VADRPRLACGGQAGGVDRKTARRYVEAAEQAFADWFLMPPQGRAGRPGLPRAARAGQTPPTTVTTRSCSPPLSVTRTPCGWRPLGDGAVDLLLVVEPRPHGLYLPDNPAERQVSGEVTV